MAPHSSEPRKQILQLRQLDLESPFAAARALRENVEDELRAIEDLARKQILQVASLGRRKFVIVNNRRDVLVLERFLDQLRFAFSNVVPLRRPRQVLGDGVDDFSS